MLDTAAEHTGVAVRRSLTEIVFDYEGKRAALPALHEAFKGSIRELEMGVSLEGAYGGTIWDRGAPDPGYQLEKVLLKSAWRHIYAGLQIDRIATANDKRRIDQFLEAPKPFTIENIREVFGDYVAAPRYHVLRGLAEVFCGLDDFYKSHSKVRVGVEGLPKRVILSGFGGYSDYGRDKVRDLVNAIESVRGGPKLEYREAYDALPSGDGRTGEVTLRGLRIKRFANGNAHVFFDKETLLLTNRALAEFYGDVLPDEAGEKPEQRATGTAVSKDLQYYPTPHPVAERAAAELGLRPNETVLEPSCGCGRLMEAARKAGGEVFGIEFDPTRVAEARAKGFDVLCGNFLEVLPPATLYDAVLMNPPFYGTHYAKHVEHAKSFLKPGGRLVAILPATARYDHGLLGGADEWGERWTDLPIGSFRESGTNVNTVLYRWTAPRKP